MNIYKYQRVANGVGVNGEGVKTIKAIKTIKTIQTPKTCMRTRKLSNSYRKTIEKLQFNDLRRIPKKRGAAAEGRRTYSAVAAVGAAALFTDVLTDVFTGVFTDVFTDVLPAVVRSRS